MSSKKQFNILIVDDEWLVREELKTMLAEYPDVKVIGEASNVREAAKLIKKLQPDTILLDIQMPGETGFDLLEKVNIHSKIIFITAYDQYAIRAFEVNALDYLLKPIDVKRLFKTIKRLRSHEPHKVDESQQLDYNDIVYVTVSGSLKFVKLSLLKCIMAQGNYSYIHYKDNKKELVSKTLQEWERILPNKYFLRIHRSAIVNFEYVDRIEKCKNHTHKIYLNDVQEPLTMSRRYGMILKKVMTW